MWYKQSVAAGMQLTGNVNVISKGKKKRNKKKEVLEKWSFIVIPYTEKVSEVIARVMKKQHNVPVAMKFWKTLNGLLVHRKDKQEKEDITECIYRVPCANCDKTYVGETGRKLGVQLQEHRTEVESKSKGVFTRSQRTASLFLSCQQPRLTFVKYNNTRISMFVWLCIRSITGNKNSLPHVSVGSSPHSSMFGFFSQ